MIPTLVSTGKRLRVFQPVSTVYLDSLPFGAKAVYSLKRLISTASVAVRIRRSSDNAEQDIGFASGLDTIDTAAISSFVGANSAFVVKWYDQTGNGFDLIQTADTTKQPRIVNAGVYDAAIVPDGTNDFMSCASFDNGTPYCNIYHDCNILSYAAVRMITCLGPIAFSGGWANYVFTSGSALFKIYSYGSQPAYNSNQRTDATGYKKRTVLMDRTLSAALELKLFSDGVDLGFTHDGNNTNLAGNFPTSTLYAFANTGTSQFSNFPIRSLVIYHTDTSAYLATINAKL